MNKETNGFLGSMRGPCRCFLSSTHGSDKLCATYGGYTTFPEITSQPFRLLQGHPTDFVECTDLVPQLATTEDPQKAVHSSQDETTKVPFSFSAEPKKKQILLILSVLTTFVNGCTASIIAPFYPQEAQLKGMSFTLVGFTFSLFYLTVLTTSPFIASYLTRIGPKFVLISGLFTQGASMILWGTLDKSPPGTPFIVTGLLCRLAESLGFSAYITAVSAIVSYEFSDHIATTYAFTQMAAEAGMVAGPAVGGLLFEAGGFPLPFYVMGSLMLLKSFVLFFFLQGHQSQPPKTQVSKLHLVLNPYIFVPMTSIITGALCTAFLEMTLANLLQPFGMSTAVVSLFFIIGPALFAITAPFTGYLTDTKGFQVVLNVGGHVVFGIGFIVVAPLALLPFLPFTIVTVIVGLILIGGSFNCCLVPSLKNMVLAATHAGWLDTLDTYAVMSGLLNSSYSFGGFIGGLAGGFLVQELGYHLSYSIMGLLSFGIAVLSFVVLFLCRRQRGQEIM